MKLYISYSLGVTDLHVAGLLRQQAQTAGIEVETSQHQLALPQDPVTKYGYGSGIPAYNSLAINTAGIISSNFMIAIVSSDSLYMSNVQVELRYAVGLKKSVLALIEGTIPIEQIPGVDYVYFNRNNLKLALEHINRILIERKQKEEANKWIVAGGIALLALYLFSKAED